MEKKLYDKNCITLDGRMDEPVWDAVEGLTGFRQIKSQNGTLAPDTEQTIFKVLPCEDRIYVGFKCMEPDVQQVIASHPNRPIWMGDRVELFLITSEANFDFYQFVVTFSGQMISNYYIESGNAQPDPYAPDWKSAVYVGDNYWSVEMEIPLTAFYMTSNDRWRKDWRANVIRCRSYDINNIQSITTCWAECDRSFWELENFKPIYNLPARPACDELRINTVSVKLLEQTETGYLGTMTVSTTNPEDATFVFSSEYADTVTVALKQGENEFTVPCYFEKLGRCPIPLELTRIYDNKVFKRYYRQTVTFEPIVMQFTSPEYRCNFYPGQDYSKIAGRIITTKPATLKLEGPGIRTQTVTPDSEGNFTFETPDFEIGDAFITATVDGYEKVQKIRRLAPTGHTMAWISGGNLIVDGEPLLARWIYAAYYRGGEALRRKYDADNLHDTRQVEIASGSVHPVDHLKACGLSNAEQREDRMPSAALFERLEKVIEANKNRDFVYYYIADEPECAMYSPIYFKYIYDYIAEKDPYHVIMMASRHPVGFLECADWFQVHPYISPEIKQDGTRGYYRPMKSMGSFVDKIAKLNRPDKCVGFLPTCFSTESYNKYGDYVTLDEYICHTWAAMIHGAKTLWPYAYHDMNDRPALYEGCRYIFSSLGALDKLLLLGKRTVLARTDDYEAVLYEHEAEKMFVSVNFTQQPQTVTLGGISGTWHEFRHDRTITGNTVHMEPLEVIIGTNTVKDTGLPTYAETAALIDKLEYERTHTGSLLFGRWRDIEMTSSTRKYASRFKLFDGVWDDFGCLIREEPDNYAEFDLTKVKPTFQKITIGGWHLEDMQVKVRIGDELITPKVVEEQTEEFSKTVLLKDAVTPDALRLEFMGREAELYEIAVF